MQFCLSSQIPGREDGLIYRGHLFVRIHYFDSCSRSTDLIVRKDAAMCDESASDAVDSERERSLEPNTAFQEAREALPNKISSGRGRFCAALNFQ
jgi:hypothetical protein